MAANGSGFHFTRLHSWVGAGVALIVTLAVYRFVDTRDFQSDPDRLAKLLESPLQESGTDLPGEWPQWRGRRRDGISREVGILTEWPEDGPKLLWKAPSGKGFSSLAVAGGRVYTLVQDGDDEAAVCWDADSGREVWRFRYSCLLPLHHGHDGPRATPTIDGKRIYCVGASGIFHCLSASGGAKLWRHDLASEFGEENLSRRTAYWGHTCSPLVDEDLVITMTGGPDGAIAAYDKRDGHLVWKALEDPAGYSSPIAITVAGIRQIAFFSGTGLVSLSPHDGRVFWRYPWMTSNYCNIATPVSAGNYVFISSYDRGCTLLEISETAGLWRAFPVYNHKRMRCHFSSPVLYREHLYGFDNANLICMEFRSGKIKWKQRGFEKGSLLVTDGHLIVLGENGKLAVAEANPEVYRQKACFTVSPNQCWTAPVLANGKLYVRDQEQILCLDLKNP